jgi:glucose/arabinose dehydrogenase
MALGPNNTIYVADMNGNHIYALPDANHDGIADSAHIAAPDVDTAHSLAFYKGALYVAQPSRVRKFLDLNNDGFYETEVPFISGISDTGYYNHFTRTIIFDTIGNHIYLGVGASCNACREGDPERGTILQFNLDGSGKKIFATGLRNPIGLAIEPESGTLWATNADRDGLGDEIPPEIITPIYEDAFYGWPFAYGSRVWINFQANTEYSAMLPITNFDSTKVNSMQNLDDGHIYIPAHETPMGILFYNDPSISRTYQNQIFFAVHGSSPGGRPIARGYKVMRRIYVDSIQDKFIAIDFLTGFLTDSINYTYWGRPCGIIQDSTGDIFLSSDQGIPAIYRIHLKEQNAVKNSGVAQNSFSVFPNPVSSSATISYSLSKHQYIKLELIDQLGRTVRLLRNEMEDAGTKTISLSTNELPAGIYYLCMQSDDETIIEKVAIIR